MMKCAWVTGAHGFLGRHTARQLASAGWRVAGIGHGTWAEAEWQPWCLDRWFSDDITIPSLRRFAESVGVPDLIVHAAGGSSVGASIQQPHQDFERTVGTTAAVLEFLRLHAPGAVLIYPSSAAVYGAARPGPIGEDSPLKPVSPYGAHKVMVEQLCRSSVLQFDLRVGIIRFFSLYGPGLRKQLLWDLSEKLRARPSHLSMSGTGDETRDFLHVEDAGRLVVQVAHQVSAGQMLVVNGGTGQPTSVREVAEEFVRLMGMPTRVSFTGEQRPGDPVHFQARLDRAVELGFKPKWAWREGVADYLAWRSLLSS